MFRATGPGFELARFEEEPVLGIIRGIVAESLPGVMDAAIAAGLRFVEITLNTSGAPRLIEKTRKDYGNSLCVGAGTVLSVKDALTAANSGADFLVSPTVKEEVAAFCRERNLAYFPGAFSPSEIERAWDAGAAMVKVFPASQLGPGYFREIKGPFQDIRLMAVGGVNRDNVAKYLEAGASGVALGGSVFSAARMTNGEFSAIRSDIEGFLLAVRSFYSKIN
ncbi:MAG: bifunctional 4-hydroxy-2-oxoglutarate aldolase/2-dehydro-3-deoxy-phosphogluconate aldolase [Nitrospinae bacterium]|nr:bifunctional 4-hydroxy-2-oxoglutarate aldolase/2-dehydro-3-deoxy-phosphogluconate aldolase [Nitrospinota bacterium]